MIDDFRSSTVWEMSEYLGPKKLKKSNIFKFEMKPPKNRVILIPYYIYKIKLFQFSLRLWKKPPTLMC